MEYFKLLQKKSSSFFLLLALLGLVNSIWAGVLLLLINSKVTGEELPFAGNFDWQIYLGLVVTSFLLARYFQGYMIDLTYRLGSDLGLAIFDKLRFSNYEEYQKLGEERVRTAMTDVQTLQRFPQAFVESFNATVMIAIGIGFLFFVNVWGAGLILLMMVVLATVYYLRSEAIAKDLNAARDLANVYQQNVNDFLRGFKEIKMSSRRSDNIFKKYLTENRHRTVDLVVRALTRHLGNELLGSYAWYLVIGFILFALTALINMDVQGRTNFIVTLLYLMGPTNILIGAIEVFIQQGIALKRLNQFNSIINGSGAVEMGHGEALPYGGSFHSIRFENVTFDYFDEKKSETFRLGPLNLEITKGETIFVTGGNGSGKSTFINLLTGLYQPRSGTIYLNGHAVQPIHYPFYRDQLSAIFTDNYLFSENYDEFDLQPSNEKLIHLVQKMGLNEVINLQNGKNKITTSLSKGQQKRVALIYSLLEDNDIFIFDEWAAEQDPHFRRYFYKVIIPELQAMGKTLIAVTHDDAYFHCAGRLIRFDYGKISSDKLERVAVES